MPEKPFKTDRRVTIETGRNPERYEEIVWTYYDRHYIIRKQVISHLVSGKFPDYIDIITDKYKSEKLYSIGFNPAYLIDVYMALDYKGGVKFNLGKDSNSVFKVDFGMSRDIEYYLMPMRT